MWEKKQQQQQNRWRIWGRFDRTTANYFNLLIIYGRCRHQFREIYESNRKKFQRKIQLLNFSKVPYFNVWLIEFLKFSKIEFFKFSKNELFHMCCIWNLKLLKYENNFIKITKWMNSIIKVLAIVIYDFFPSFW